MTMRQADDGSVAVLLPSGGRPRGRRHVANDYLDMQSVGKLALACRAPLACLKCMWLVLTVAGLAATGYHLYTLVEQFFKYESGFSVRCCIACMAVRTMGRVARCHYKATAQTTLLTNNTFEFPAVSVCKLSPMRAEQLAGTTMCGLLEAQSAFDLDTSMRALPHSIHTYYCTTVAGCQLANPLRFAEDKELWRELLGDTHVEGGDSLLMTPVEGYDDVGRMADIAASAGRRVTQRYAQEPPLAEVLDANFTAAYEFVHGHLRGRHIFDWAADYSVCNRSYSALGNDSGSAPAANRAKRQAEQTASTVNVESTTESGELLTPDTEPTAESSSATEGGESSAQPGATEGGVSDPVSGSAAGGGGGAQPPGAAELEGGVNSERPPIATAGGGIDSNEQPPPPAATEGGGGGSEQPPPPDYHGEDEDEYLDDYYDEEGAVGESIDPFDVDHEQVFNPSSGSAIRRLLRQSLLDDLLDVRGVFALDQAFYTKYNLTSSLSDMLYECAFDRSECNASHFHTFFDADMGGHCYTFNAAQLWAGGRSGGAFNRTTFEGRSYGLRLTLNVDAGDDLAILSQVSGVRVVVHHPHTVPFMAMAGIDAPTETQTAIGVSRRDIRRLEAPYQGNCTEQYPQMYTSFVPKGEVYNFDMCKHSCTEYHIFAACNCSLYDMGPGPLALFDDDGEERLVDNVKQCDAIRNKRQYQCVAKVKLRLRGMGKRPIDCGCKQKCHEAIYGTRVSQSPWPSESYRRLRIATLMSQGNGTKKSRVARRLAQRQIEHEPGTELAHVHLYLESKTYEVVVESAAYPLRQLLADIGGAAGLYLGMTIMTLFELVHMLLMLGALGCGGGGGAREGSAVREIATGDGGRPVVSMESVDSRKFTDAFGTRPSIVG